MSQQIHLPAFTPFVQIPVWDDNETFTMTGKQVRAVQQMAETYSKFIDVLEGFFSENLNNGKITIKYQDIEGNELSKEQIDEMLREYERLAAEAISSQINGEGSN